MSTRGPGGKAALEWPVDSIPRDLRATKSQYLDWPQNHGAPAHSPQAECERGDIAHELAAKLFPGDRVRSGHRVLDPNPSLSPAHADIFVECPNSSSPRPWSSTLRPSVLSTTSPTTITWRRCSRASRDGNPSAPVRRVSAPATTSSSWRWDFRCAAFCG